MKTYLVGLTLLFLFSANSQVTADQVYTWTDKDGNLHITVQPPPKNAKVKDVMKYEPQPQKTVPDNQQRPDSGNEIAPGIQRQTAPDKQGLDEVQQARAEAEKARTEAKIARGKAEEAAKTAKEYIETHNRNEYERRAYQYQMRKAADEAKTAQEQARIAEEKAIKAEKKAKLVEERVRDLDD